MKDFLISALSLSSSYCFLLRSRASRRACLSSSFWITLCSLALIISSFACLWAAIEPAWFFKPFNHASATILFTLTSIWLSPWRKLVIFSMSQGITLSCRDLVRGLTKCPWSTSAFNVFSLKPTKCCLASTLATYFLWAAFLSSFLAFYCIFLLSSSCFLLISAASSLWASMSSAFLISSYSFCYSFIILSSSSSSTNMRAYSSVFLTNTLSIGSISESKSKSSGSCSKIYVPLQFSLDGILGWNKGTGGRSK